MSQEAETRIYGSWIFQHLSFRTLSCSSWSDCRVNLSPLQTRGIPFTADIFATFYVMGKTSLHVWTSSILHAFTMSDVKKATFVLPCGQPTRKKNPRKSYFIIQWDTKYLSNAWALNQIEFNFFLTSRAVFAFNR